MALVAEEAFQTIVTCKLRSWENLGKEQPRQRESQGRERAWHAFRGRGNGQWTRPSSERTPREVTCWCSGQSQHRLSGQRASHASPALAAIVREQHEAAIRHL